MIKPADKPGYDRRYPPTIEDMRERWDTLINTPRVGGIVLADGALDRRRLREHYAMRERQMVDGRGRWKQVRNSWEWVPNISDELDRQMIEARKARMGDDIDDPFADVADEIAGA